MVCAPVVAEWGFEMNSPQRIKVPTSPSEATVAETHDGKTLRKRSVFLGGKCYWPCCFSEESNPEVHFDPDTVAYFCASFYKEVEIPEGWRVGDPEKDRGYKDKFGIYAPSEGCFVYYGGIPKWNPNYIYILPIPQEPKSPPPPKGHRLAVEEDKEREWPNGVMFRCDYPLGQGEWKPNKPVRWAQEDLSLYAVPTHRDLTEEELDMPVEALSGVEFKEEDKDWRLVSWSGTKPRDYEGTLQFRMPTLVSPPPRRERTFAKLPDTHTVVTLETGQPLPDGSLCLWPHTSNEWELVAYGLCVINGPIFAIPKTVLTQPQQEAGK